MNCRIVRIEDNRTLEHPAEGTPPYVITLARVFLDSLGDPFVLPDDMISILQGVARVHNRTGTLAVGMEFWLYANPACPEGLDIDYSPGKTVSCFFTEAEMQDVARRMSGGTSP